MSAITAKTLLKTMLNSQVTDPYPGARSGNQFFDEDDGINLQRANTFPKGYIFFDRELAPTSKERFSRKGWELKHARFIIHYFVKDKISYTVSGTKYQDASYANYMAESIKESLEDNVSLGSGYYIEDIQEDIEAARQLTNNNAPFVLFEVRIPVIIKWSRQYG